MVLSDTGDVAEGARWSLLCVARYVRFFSHFLRSVVNSLAQVALRWIELGLTTGEKLCTCVDMLIDCLHSWLLQSSETYCGLVSDVARPVCL